MAEGARDHVSELRAHEFVREMWPVILRTVDGVFDKTAHLFDLAGSDAGAAVAFQNICNNNNRSKFSYGQFYVSLGLGKARRYAMRSRSGSELLLFIEEGLKVIRMLDSSFAEKLCTSYPEPMSWLELPAHPVVLVLSDIEECRLLDEGGGPPKLRVIELALDYKDNKSVAIEPSFRVSCVTAVDIMRFMT